MIVKDWIPVVMPVHGTKRTTKCFVYRAGSHIYMASRAVSSKRDRFHVFALPESGLAVPVRIGCELPLGHCCRVVQKHVMAVVDFGEEAVLIRLFPILEQDMEVARMCAEEVVPDGALEEEFPEEGE